MCCRMLKRKGGWIGIQVVTFLFLICKGVVVSTKYRIDVSSYETVAKGTCVIIPCKFTADGKQGFLGAKGFWILQGDDIVASSDTSTPGKKRNFHLVGDPNKGKCTLKITDAQMTDAGRYYFRFEQSRGSLINYNYNEKNLELVVKDISVHGYAIQVDQEVAVQKGHCVTIPCSFTANHKKSFSNSKGYWKTSCSEYVASNLKSIKLIKTNFELKGDPDQGDCTLKITDAQEADSGKYFFRYEDEDDDVRFSYYSNLVTIRVVTDREEKPKISGPRILTEGKEATITCTAPGDCPNPQYTWGNGSGLWTSTPKLTFVPKRNHHQMSLTCNTEFPLARNEIKLSVHYPPSIIITTDKPEMNISNDKVTVKEGDTLQLKCSVDSNPKAKVTWMKGNKTLKAIKEIGSELILYLPNITSSDHGTYDCLASNNIGKTLQAIHIIVEYSRWPHLTLTLGIVFGIILLVSIGLGVFFFLKHRNKGQSGNSGPVIGFEKKHDAKNTAQFEEDPDSNIYANM